VQFDFFGGFFLMKTIYVGNLPFNATEEQVRSAFQAHGEVASVKLISDRETGRPRGFAFVEMEDDQADVAIREMEGFNLGGRNLKVNEARAREGGYQFKK
jgi:RNA recognition motif-containing protein